MTENHSFSVLLSVYSKDSPEYFREALESIARQTILPSETVVVLDGPVGQEILSVLEQFDHKLNIKRVQMLVNGGLAVALREGLMHCSCDLVARMDSDDICMEDRFEKQLQIFRRNSNVDVVGGLISEFDGVNSTVRRIRWVPETHDKIYSRAKFLSPVNHVTVMYKKQAVLDAGNYQNFRGIEDYPLWVAMLVNGSKFYNIQSTLVEVRAGSGFNDRRGGVRYASEEFRALLFMFKLGFIGFFQLIFNASTRAFVRLLGSSFRGVIYLMLRKKTRKSDRV